MIYIIQHRRDGKWRDTQHGSTKVEAYNSKAVAVSILSSYGKSCAKTVRVMAYGKYGEAYPIYHPARALVKRKVKSMSWSSIITAGEGEVIPANEHLKR